MKRAVIVILISLVLLAGMAAVVVWTMITSYESTPHAGAGKAVAVQIPRGAGDHRGW